VHAIPHRKGVLQGVVNVEGELLLQFDMGGLLGLRGGASAPARVFPRLLVLRRDGQDWAFAVDEVHKIMSLDRAALRPAAPQAEADGRAYAEGSFDCDGRPVALLDEELLAGGLRRCQR
jgi:chemotaxis signal transduction protein